MHLQSIRIKRFKGIEDAAFDLTDVNLFIGSNNSGKSTIIQALHLAFTLLQSLDVAQKWPAKNQKSVSVSPLDLIYIPSQDPYSLGFGGKLLEDAEKAININLVFSDGKALDIRLRKGRITNVLVEIDPTDVARAHASLAEPYSIFSPGLAGVSRTETFVSNGVLLRALARGDANVMLRNIMYRLNKNEERWSAFEDDVEQLFDKLKINIRFKEDVDEHIDIRVITGERDIPLELSGTGLLQALQILSYYHLYQPKIIVLDEPDSHLHPNNQWLLCDLLSNLAVEQRVQILLTTHSRHVLEALQNSASVLWVEQGKVRKSNIEEQVEILLSIGALDIKEKLSSGKYSVIFLTEDRITNYLNKILESNGFEIEKTAILSYYGVTDPHNLIPIIKNSKDVSSAKIVVHRDRDYLNPDEIEKWKETVRAHGADPFITQSIDIEGYYCTPEYLRSAVPELPAEQIDRILEIAAEEIKDAVIRDMINGRIDIERKAKNAGNIDIGALSADLTKKVSKDPLSYSKGKTLIGKIRGHLQEQGFSLPLKADSSLVDDTLKTIAGKLFGKK